MAGYQNYLTDEDKLRKQEIQQSYNDLGTQAQSGIDQQYASSIAEQKSQLAALPQQYDSLRHQNDYELEVAARRFNDMMAMEGQKNSGLNRTEQAGLQAAHSQTSGDIAVQQKAAEQEIQNAISKILAEREKAKSDAALQYQTMGVQAGQDFENAQLANYREDYWTQAGYQHDIDMAKLGQEQQLELMQVQQDYDKEMAAIDQEYALGRITAEEASTLRIQTEAARIERENTLYAAQVESAYGGSDTSWGDYSDYAEAGKTAGINAATKYGVYYDGNIKYGAEKGETQKQAIADELFDWAFTVTGYDENGELVLSSNLGGNLQSMTAFSNALAAAGLGNFNTQNSIDTLAKRQLAKRAGAKSGIILSNGSINGSGIVTNIR